MTYPGPNKLHNETAVPMERVLHRFISKFLWGRGVPEQTISTESVLAVVMREVKAGESPPYDPIVPFIDWVVEVAEREVQSAKEQR